MNIPIVAIVDTNGNPDNVTYAIPGNDDAVRAIELFTSKVAEAVLDGKKRRVEKELEAEKAGGETEEGLQEELMADGTPEGV